MTANLVNMVQGMAQVASGTISTLAPDSEIMSVVMANAVASIMAATSGPAYIVHGAKTSCSCGLRSSHVVVPLSHGVFIHDIAQLNISDYKPYVNIQTFGCCISPENPSVQAAAEEVVQAVNKESKGFLNKVLSHFCDSSDEVAGESLVSQCAAACTPNIIMPWDNGKETVNLAGFQPLLATGTLTCLYGGVIKLESTGQPE